MLYRVIGKVYVDGILIDPENDRRYVNYNVGDGCEIPWRYLADSPKNQASPVKAGDPMPPSTSLQPLDDEAKRMYEEAYGTEPGEFAERDPTAVIPVTGVQAAEQAVKKPNPKPAPPAPPKVEPIKSEEKK